MIDLHTHVLPGIDDGVRTDEEAVEFARIALDEGIDTLVATPHCKEGFFFNTRADVLERVGKLQELFRQHELAIDLVPGAEVHICPDLVQRVQDGRAPTLADNGKTLLLELSLTQYPVELENLVFQLKLSGLIVVLAHPERIRYFQDDVERYARLVEQGAWGQITSGSITGQFGDKTKTFSEELLRRGLVHCIASDAHNVRGRPPRLAAALEIATGVLGEPYAEAMVTSIPRALLDGREPEPPTPSTEHKRSLLARLFGSR